MIAIRAAATTAVVTALLLMAAPAHAADPSSNTSPSGMYNCDVNSSQITDSCLSGAIADFNTARAKEGLGPINLPSNFAYLPATYQFLVLANIDRVDRGLVPFVGLSRTLDAYALKGALASADPPFPYWTTYGSGNWVGSVNSLWGEYEWMYDDGPGSTNLDCPAAGGPGCWGHRHNIIMNWPSPMVMGVAIANNGAATIVLGKDTHDAADEFLWANEFPKFAGRAQPAVGAAGGTHVLSVSIFRHSRTAVQIQRYYSGAWHTVARATTNGTASRSATWKYSFKVGAGKYRVATSQNSRFLKAMSKPVTVH